MGVITWGGIKSSDLGIIVELVPDYEIPERNVTSSRSFQQIGDCLIDQKSFQTVTRTYHLAMVNKDLSGSYERFARIIAEWLMAPKGFSKLVEDETISGINAPVYRMAYFAGGVELNNLYGVGLRAEVQFQCMPELYPDETVGLGDITDRAFTIYNTWDFKAPYMDDGISSDYVSRNIPKMYFNRYPKIRMGVNFGSAGERAEYVCLAFYKDILALPSATHSTGFEIPSSEDADKCCQLQADFTAMSDKDYKKFYNYRRVCHDLGYLVPIYYNLLTNSFETKVTTNGVLKVKKVGNSYNIIQTENDRFETIRIPVKWSKGSASLLSYSYVKSNSMPELYSLCLPASEGNACGFLTVEIPTEMFSITKYVEVDRAENFIAADKI